MNSFWLAMLGIVLVAVAFEVYKPLGVALTAIALTTMFLRGKV